MKQQIEELARKCGAWNQVYGDRNFMIDEHFDIAKFAELIVAECMKLNSKELSITAIERLLPLYEEHFGVEE
jgi:hypothetical protein